jgi:hypothetical protein
MGHWKPQRDASFERFIQKPIWLDAANAFLIRLAFAPIEITQQWE